MLDPSVEMLGVEVNGYRLLVHGELETALAVPPGDGLLELLDTLFDGPTAIETLRRDYSDQRLVDAIVAALAAAGFAHRFVGAAPTGVARAALLVDAAARRARRSRRSVTIDLDAADFSARLAEVGADPSACSLVLRCDRLASHGATIERLADERYCGSFAPFEVAIRTRDANCDAALARTILALGASVIIEQVVWPAPDAGVAGLVELTDECVAVHVVLQPDETILDANVRDRALSWAKSMTVTGLRLRFDPAMLSCGRSDDSAFVEVFDAVRAMEDAFGDVCVETLPSDDVLIGVASPDERSAAASDIEGRFRRAYLRHRVPFLKASEGDNLWSQIPEVEDKLVRIEEDLLPNHPAMLGIGPGSRVVDVCGGLGRVARRLSPLVGPDGLIVSIEMLRLLSGRARAFAFDRGFANLSFRTGRAERLPLVDRSMDAAVNEWTGAIWELGIGPAMLREMARVVRPGGRIAVTHRLVRLPLARLAEPWVQYDDIYEWIRAAFEQAGLPIVAERIWGQVSPTLVGENATRWRKQYIPSLIDPFDFVYQEEISAGTSADVFVTFVAEVSAAQRVGQGVET
jgi:SAM-dependent methyltransferase